MHALARQVAYGKQGVLTGRDLEGQRHTSSCLTLIMACIIYWQAMEINRVLLEEDLEGMGVDLSLLEHISRVPPGAAGRTSSWTASTCSTETW